MNPQFWLNAFLSRFMGAVSEVISSVLFISSQFLLIFAHYLARNQLYATGAILWPISGRERFYRVQFSTGNSFLRSKVKFSDF